MPKPINKTWGHCRCRVSGCGKLADIRRMKSHERGARYLVCPKHGTDKAQGAGPQAALDAWIDEQQKAQAKIDAWIDEHQIPDQDAAALEPGQDAPEPNPEPVPEPMPIQATPDTAPPGPKPAPGMGRLVLFIKRAHKELVAW